MSPSRNVGHGEVYPVRTPSRDSRRSNELNDELRGDSNDQEVDDGLISYGAESGADDLNNHEAFRQQNSLDDDDLSLNTVEMLEREGYIYHHEGSDDEDRSVDEVPVEYRMTPQEVADRLHGDEDPYRKGWGHKFLRTVIETNTGPMTFIRCLSLSRHLFLRRAAAKKYRETGENNYSPSVHITHNAGFTPHMLEASSLASCRTSSSWRTPPTWRWTSPR